MPCACIAKKKHGVAALTWSGITRNMASNSLHSALFRRTLATYFLPAHASTSYLVYVTVRTSLLSTNGNSGHLAIMRGNCLVNDRHRVYWYRRLISEVYWRITGNSEYFSYMGLSLEELETYRLRIAIILCI